MNENGNKNGLFPEPSEETREHFRKQNERADIRLWLLIIKNFHNTIIEIFFSHFNRADSNVIAQAIIESFKKSYQQNDQSEFNIGPLEIYVKWIRLTPKIVLEYEVIQRNPIIRFHLEDIKTDSDDFKKIIEKIEKVAKDKNQTILTDTASVYQNKNYFDYAKNKD